jgi:GNAT superfamily N-acetyltransferase
MHANELETVIALLDEHLGVLEGRLDDFETRLAAQTLTVYVVSDPQNLLLGVGTCSLLDLDASRHKLHNNPAMCVVLKGMKAPVGWLETLAVAPSARGCGLGAKLLAACLQTLRQAGAVTALSLAWRAPGPRAEGLLRAAGLMEVAAVPAFWAQADAANNYCPYCGRDCVCTAALYRCEI